MSENFVKIAMSDLENFFWGVYWSEKRYEAGLDMTPIAVTHRDHDDLKREKDIIRSLGLEEEYLKFFAKQEERKLKFHFDFTYGG